jgi:oxygen-independent coproporphyrinogen-3 oxidase
LQAPSILNNRNRSNFVSIETTPLIAATELSKLKLLVDRGVYRVSVGIQSTSSSMLAKVNRINQVNMEAAGMQNLKDAGFKRISTDIIFGLPGQTMDDWKNDLRNVVELKPDCITTYDCLYRGKGRSIKRSQEIPLCETYGKMYDYSYEFLTSNGYFASYGSLNFSRRQDETGTSSYFENRLLHGKSYLGLGNYASSLIDSYWLFAPYSVNGFVNTLSTPNNILRDDLLSSWPIHDAYRLPLQEIAAKQILLSLSYGQISGSAFLKNFPGYSINDFYGESLDYLVNEVKWLDYDSAKDTYFLRENCFYLLPQIRSLFYSNNALQWYEKNIMKSS